MGLRWAWRTWRMERALGVSRDEARRALAAWVQPDGSFQPLTGPFDPHHALWGIWPTFPYTSFGPLVQGAQGDGVGYFRGVLYWKANQPCRPVPQPGPHVFTSGTRNCVVSFKTFFGIPNASNGVVDSATWQAIQWCVWNLPNRS